MSLNTLTISEELQTPKWAETPVSPQVEEVNGNNSLGYFEQKIKEEPKIVDAIPEDVGKTEKFCDNLGLINGIDPDSPIGRAVNIRFVTADVNDVRKTELDPPAQASLEAQNSVENKGNNKTITNTEAVERSAA